MVCRLATTLQDQSYDVHWRFVHCGPFCDLSLISAPAAIMHFALWHSKTVFGLIRDARVCTYCIRMPYVYPYLYEMQTKEPDDPHYHKMKVYREVPVRSFRCLDSLHY